MHYFTYVRVFIVLFSILIMLFFLASYLPCLYFFVSSFVLWVFADEGPLHVCCKQDDTESLSILLAVCIRCHMMFVSFSLLDFFLHLILAFCIIIAAFNVYCLLRSFFRSCAYRR